MKLDLKITISELLRRYPSSLDVFVRRRMLCAGCPAETFHTLEEAACFNGILLEDLVDDICRCINQAGRYESDPGKPF